MRESVVPAARGGAPMAGPGLLPPSLPPAFCSLRSLGPGGSERVYSGPGAVLGPRAGDMRKPRDTEIRSLLCLRSQANTQRAGAQLPSTHGASMSASCVRGKGKGAELAAHLILKSLSARCPVDVGLGLPTPSSEPAPWAPAMGEDSGKKGRRAGQASLPAGSARGPSACWGAAL